MNNYNKDNRLILSEIVLKRFIVKIEIPINRSECWEWVGARHNNKYGIFSCNEVKTKMAHRIMFELVKGKIKDKLVIDHLCSNKSCVNPGHLEQVTNHINLQRGNTILQHNGYCKKGHKRDKDNIYKRPDGHLDCRKCLGNYHPERKDYVDNKKKTHCNRGHEFTVKNTYVTPANKRQCKECMRILRDERRKLKGLILNT